MIVLRLIAVMTLLLVAAFCAFGILATFEPPGSQMWRIGYAAAGVACLVAAAWAIVGFARGGSHGR